MTSSSLRKLMQQGDLSESDQQELSRSILDLKAKRAQKRRARVAELPFEIRVRSWYYRQNATEQSASDLEKMYRIPKTTPHTFVSKTRLSSKISHSYISCFGQHHYKFHIDATIRCPDFASARNVWNVFRNGAIHPHGYPGAHNQVFLNFPTHPRIHNWAEVSMNQLGIDTAQPGYAQKIWKHFNKDETSRISVTYRDEVIYDNNDPNQMDLTAGFLNIVGRFMEAGGPVFRTNPKTGQFLTIR